MTEKRKGMTIRKKLLLSYFSLVLLIVIIGIIGISNIREVYQNGNEIYLSNLKSVDYLKSIDLNVKEIDQSLMVLMSRVGSSYQEEYLSDINRLQKENEGLLEAYSKLNVTRLEKRRYNQFRLSLLTFDKQIEVIKEKLKAGDREAAINAYTQELTPVRATTYELIEAIVELSAANAQSKNDNNQKIYDRLILVIVITMLLAILIAVIVTVKMSNYFTSKLGAIQRLAKRISEYNISDDIRGMSNDEFGQTMEALNDSQFMMRELMERIIEESSTISDTGEEVSLAVRKSGQRIENINVKVLQSGEMAGQMDNTVRTILEDRSLDQDTVERLNNILKKSEEARGILSEARAELSSVAMYLEQIGITSDYQNEIANSHKEQVKKFKV